MKLDNIDAVRSKYFSLGKWDHLSSHFGFMMKPFLGSKVLSVFLWCYTYLTVISMNCSDRRRTEGHGLSQTDVGSAHLVSSDACWQIRGGETIGYRFLSGKSTSASGSALFNHGFICKSITGLFMSPWRNTALLPEVQLLPPASEVVGR